MLSACETGIGTLEGNEGMQSLQRALQVAGATATISSLWEIPDEATQLLITRFFENHWQRRMGKAESLREAQLWLLRAITRRNQNQGRLVGNNRNHRRSAASQPLGGLHAHGKLGVKTRSKCGNHNPNHELSVAESDRAALVPVFHSFPSSFNAFRKST